MHRLRRGWQARERNGAWADDACLSWGGACENASLASFAAPLFAGAIVNGSGRKAHDFNVLVFSSGLIVLLVFSGFAFFYELIH